jgi:hypothetical protein
LAVASGVYFVPGIVNMSERGETTEADRTDGRERRQSRRKKSLLRATLVTDAGESECSVLDLSRGGARIGSPIAVTDEQAVTLIVKPIGTFVGLVAWRGDGSFGVRFLAQHGATGASPTALDAALQGSPMLMRKPTIDADIAGRPRMLAAAPASVAEPSPEPKGSSKDGRVRKFRPQPPERSFALRRGDVICVLRKKPGGTDPSTKASPACRRRETLRMKDLASYKLVEIDARNFMALIEQGSAFSIALMRVASCGAERSSEHAAAPKPRRCSTAEPREQQAPSQDRRATERPTAVVA